MRPFRRTAAAVALAVALPVLPALVTTPAGADDGGGATPVTTAAYDAAARKGAPLKPRGGKYRARVTRDRKSTRLNSSHVKISYAVFCLKKKNSAKPASEPMPAVIG